MQNCPPAGRTETPQGFFYTFFYLGGFIIFFIIIIIFYLFALLPPPLSHTFLYIFCVFLFILLVGRQSALLGVSNTESSTQASDPTRNKFVCVCVSVPINGKVVAFFFSIHISVPAGDSNPRRSAHLQPPKCRRAKPLDHENLAIYIWEN